MFYKILDVLAKLSVLLFLVAIIAYVANEQWMPAIFFLLAVILLEIKKISETLLEFKRGG